MTAIKEIKMMPMGGEARPGQVKKKFLNLQKCGGRQVESKRKQAERVVGE